MRRAAERVNRLLWQAVWIWILYIAMQAIEYFIRR